MTRNPYLIGLLSGAVFFVVLAYMLLGAISEITDYATYEVPTVTIMQGLIVVLLALAGAAVIGSVVIGGVAWSLRRGDATGTGELARESSDEMPAR